METDTPIPPRHHFVCDGCGHMKPMNELSVEKGRFYFCISCEPKK